MRMDKMTMDKCPLAESKPQLFFLRILCGLVPFGLASSGLVLFGSAIISKRRSQGKKEAVRSPGR